MPQLTDKQNIQAMLYLLSQISTLWKHLGISLNFLVFFQMLQIRKTELMYFQGKHHFSGLHICPVCQMSDNLHLPTTPGVCCVLRCLIMSIQVKKRGGIILPSCKGERVVEVPLQRIPMQKLSGENSPLKNLVIYPPGTIVIKVTSLSTN